MTRILNIASYKFVTLDQLDERRNALFIRAKSLQLKGTILLSTEGINLNLSGLPQDIADFIEFLQGEPYFADLTFRQSYSDEQPFKHLRVKIKPEIITLRQSDIDPEKAAAPALSPQEFKKWLDEERDMTILDTRNDYEVEFGTFKGAKQLDLHDFSEFPQAIDQVSRDKPVVMFCTGGIRCEKAAIVLLKAGYSQVYQLQGGILNYFSEVGGEHYEGECFVFDQRIAVDPTLSPTGTKQCLECQGPIKYQSTCTTCIPTNHLTN